jgi:NAD(P)-dependent dehydrogenase (short-subunit alcohol dehydrogenase family)
MRRFAIVTGGSRRLGRAYARRLAALGAKIAICDLSLKSFEEFEAESRDMTGDSTVAEIEAAGGSAFGVELDVADRAAVDAMVTQVAEKWGRVDILVANAGGGRGRPLDTKASTLDTGLLDLVLHMNLYGTIYCCNSVAPIMKQQRYGKIVTVASVAGLSPSADTAQPRRRSRITHVISPRIWGRTASLQIASPRGRSLPDVSCRPSFREAPEPIPTQRRAAPCGASVRSRTAPTSWSS